MGDLALGSNARRGIALINGHIVLPDRVVTGQALIVRGASIVGLADPRDLSADVERLDVGGRLITPGLVDIHIHGALGHTFNEPDEAAWTTILRENARRGVTSLLATLAPTPVPDMIACFAFGRQWMAQAREGAQVLGLHLESPYINPVQRGALDATSMRTPDDGAAWLLEHSDVLRIVVLAPELPAAAQLIADLTARGVIVAAGHSLAKDEQVLEAMRAGLRHVTHIWSAMSTVVREGPWRKPGLLEAALVFDGLTVEMIADNRHLPPTLMKLAYRAIGPDRLCVISDATSGAGLPEGSFFSMGGMTYEVLDGVGQVLDRSSFAGSTTLLSQMLPILTGVVGVPLVEAIRMVTLNPARAIRADDRKGSIAVGKDADLAIFETDFTPWRVMIGGRWVGQAGE